MLVHAVRGEGVAGRPSLVERFNNNFVGKAWVQITFVIQHRNICQGVLLRASALKSAAIELADAAAGQRLDRISIRVAS